MSIEDYTGGSSQEAGVLVVTTNDVPGHDVKQVIGEVFGLTVRTRHLGAQIGAGLKAVIGGELRGLTKTLVQARTEAMDRLVEAARARGANAVLAVRYDVTAAQDSGTEICAYGTAAVIAPAA
ncbi:YbjQ family protein [Streptomyces sp. NPDC017673]|uniref:YbjQ family protein n=1 Tax=unclassified Streptomyces TaxID=2593676 RepID=UPI0037BD8CDA